MPVRLYHLDELLPHSAELSANFADEFMSARGLIASLRHGATVERRDRRETTLINYISPLHSWRRDKITFITSMDRNSRIAHAGKRRFVKYFKSFFSSDNIVIIRLVVTDGRGIISDLTGT